ncbi:MAG: hypothetical protein CME60_06005 [Halobacteriovoraceae bacterium]|nr:hypothetical protein [Halobacteriovoraceae bacterium]
MQLLSQSKKEKVRAMKVVKWFSLFMLMITVGVFPNVGYGQDGISKAPKDDSYQVELNDPQTVEHLQRITKGEFEEYMTGRSPLSVDIPKNELDRLREVFDSRRAPKDRPFRAPAIIERTSRSISE